LVELSRQSAESGRDLISVDVSIRPDWNPAQLKVAVLVQDSGHGRILGGAQIPYRQ